MSAPAGVAPPPEAAVRGADLRLLAEILDLAGALFLQPVADRRSRASELLRDRSFDFPGGPQIAVSLRALARAEAADLDVEYVRLFLHGRAATAHPYESFYRTGALMDPECLEGLGALFAAAGIAPEKGGPPPDHLGVEASFLALLLRGLSTAEGEATPALRAIAAELVNGHLLPFVSAFRERLAPLAPCRTFDAAAAALASAAAAARNMV